MVCLSVADPDLQIRVHPDSEIRGGSRGWGGVVSKKFFQPSWPLFDLKSREVGLSGPSPGCATVYAGLLPVYTS